jgi:hypothetical protein
MAEMLVQSESLTSIADKIRVLSGTESAMGLDDMANHVGEANTDVATEADLIVQIAGALEGKVAGSDLTPIIDALTDKGVEVPEGTNVTGLAELITAIEADGGASVQTCTIKFDSKYNDIVNVQPAVLTRYVDGAYTTKIMYGWGTEGLKDVTVTDVVCGSAIVLANMSNLDSYTFVKTTSFDYQGKGFISGGVELVKSDSSLKYLVFMAPTVPEATGIIGFIVT